MRGRILRVVRQTTVLLAEQWRLEVGRPVQGHVRLDRHVRLPAVALNLLAGLVTGLTVGKVLFPDNTMTVGHALEATVLIWLVVVAATVFGIAGSIRAIAGERALFEFRRTYGLSPAALIASKFLFHGSVAAAATILAAVTALAGQTLPSEFRDSGILPQTSGVILPDARIELIVVASCVAVASTAVGLLLSAFASKTEHALYALPLVLLFQVVVAAPLLTPPTPGMAALGTLSVTSWGMDAAAATVDLNELRRPALLGVEARAAEFAKRYPDSSIGIGPPLWDHEAGAWTTAVSALWLVCGLSLVASWSVLTIRRVPISEAD